MTKIPCIKTDQPNLRMHQTTTMRNFVCTHGPVAGRVIRAGKTNNQRFVSLYDVLAMIDPAITRGTEETYISSMGIRIRVRSWQVLDTRYGPEPMITSRDLNVLLSSLPSHQTYTFRRYVARALFRYIRYLFVDLPLTLESLGSHVNCLRSRCPDTPVPVPVPVPTPAASVPTPSRPTILLTSANPFAINALVDCAVASSDDMLPYTRPSSCTIRYLADILHHEMNAQNHTMSSWSWASPPPRSPLVKMSPFSPWLAC